MPTAQANPTPPAAPAIAGGADIEIVVQAGDRVTYVHAGETRVITVAAVEEREDFGFYRLTAEGPA